MMTVSYLLNKILVNEKETEYIYLRSADKNKYQLKLHNTFVMFLL